MHPGILCSDVCICIYIYVCIYIVKSAMTLEQGEYCSFRYMSTPGTWVRPLGKPDQSRPEGVAPKAHIRL